MTEEKTMVYDKRFEAPAALKPPEEQNAVSAQPEPLPDPQEDLYKFDEIAEAFRRKSAQPASPETDMHDGTSEGALPPPTNSVSPSSAFPESEIQIADKPASVATPAPAAALAPIGATVPAAEAAPLTAVSAEAVDEHMAQRREQRRVQEQRKDRHKSSTKSAAASGAKAGGGKGGGGKGKGGKKGKKPQSRAKRILKGVLAGILIFVIAAVCVVAVWVFSVIKDLPKHDPAEIQASLNQTSTIYDDQGKVMQNIYTGDANRVLVTYGQIPKNLVNGVVAVEDKTFWTNNGFNIIRMVGAVWDSLKGGGDISGTSTITQQLARNVWLTDIKSERTLDRKIKEAYYARELTNALSKEDIITAYLNTIAFGNHSYGVGAASKAYFNKDIKDLNLIECAALAALPQSPTTYSYISTVPVGDVSPNDPRVLLVTDQYIYLFNDAGVPRIHLVLDLMLQQGYITQAEHDQAYSQNIRDYLHPQPLTSASDANYFVDYLIQQVASNLLATYPGQLENMDDAMQMVYSKGLQIHSTFNQRMQDICTQEFEDAANIPGTSMSLDKAGNCLNEQGNIMLYAYANMFEDRADGPWFTMQPSEYEMQADGSMIIKKGGRFNVYNTTNPDGTKSIVLEFASFFTKPDGILHIASGGTISIPDAYKGMDSNGNLILSAKFFSSKDNIFTKDANENYEIGPSHFSLRPLVIQPQGAATIIDHTNGQIKAMVGGRGTTVAMAYNRADNPHSPGSTMKPLGAYGPALEMSAEGVPAGNDTTNGNASDNTNSDASGNTTSSFGTYWTPLSVIDDSPMQYQGKDWPSNWYSGNRGPQTLRNAVQQSINVCAVKVQLAVGNQRSVDFLKKLGITTLVTTGSQNDMGPASLALGGMTHGLKPIESASAYGTFANLGVHVDPITYTSVTDSNGNVVLDGKPKSTQAMDPGAAYIMNDILHTTVTSGIATTAQVKGVPVAGKTGTNEKRNYDAWFCGNTPKYTMSVWLGCDQKVPMNQNSAAAARLFSKIMTQIYQGMDPGQFPAQPANVVNATVDGMSDIFLKGTVPTSIPGQQEVDVCADSGYLATPWCPNTETKKFGTLNSMTAIDTSQPNQTAPTYYCNLHNLDPSQFPIDPNVQLDTNFGKIKTPNLAGQSQTAAQKALTDAGLVVGQVLQAFNDAAANTVLSQNPAPGTMLAKGSAVNMTVSRGPDPATMTQVPNLIGLDQAGAASTLVSATLALGAVNTAATYDSSHAAGTVLSSSPPAGSTVKIGSSVTITINPNPPPPAGP